MDRRGYARSFYWQALLAASKPHQPSELRYPDLRFLAFALS